MRARILLGLGLVSIATLLLTVGIPPVMNEPPPLVIEEVDSTPTPVATEQAVALQEQSTIAIEEATIEKIAPYLDAAIRMEKDLEMVNCTDREKANFAKLPSRGIPRNTVLEWLALDTVFRFRTNKTGDRISNYIPLAELDKHLAKFAMKDSPWGLFGDSRLQMGISPYLEAAKADAIASRDERRRAQAAQQPPS